MPAANVELRHCWSSRLRQSHDVWRSEVHIVRLDHVTINTSELEKTLRFYEHFFGFKPGFRPDFAVGGAWLYAEGGDYPILHLRVESKPAEGGKFDHVAFRLVGLDAFLQKVKAAGVRYTASPIFGTTLAQVQIHDPNGVMIEATFDGEEMSPAQIVRK